MFWDLPANHELGPNAIALPLKHGGCSMSQSPTEKRGEPGSTRPNVPNDTVTAVSSLCTSARDNAPSAAPNMVSEEAPSSAAQHQENARDSRCGIMVEDDRSSHQHPRERPSLSLSTTSLVGDQRVADSPLAMRSLLPTESGPPSRRQSPRAKTRNRGSSLRRSLFSKNIQNPPASDGMTMEVESTDASSVPPKSTTTAGKSEKGHASVSVSTYAVDEDSSIPPGPTKDRNTWTNREFAYKRSPLLQPRQELLQKLRQWCQNRKRMLLRTTETPPTADGRHINLGSSDLSIPIDERTRRPYVNNVIRSSRYTVLNFFPRQLLAQFSKLANFYFLTVSILQMIPGLSTTGTYTTIVPLLIFVGISMAKEGYDDIWRWRLDKEENNRDTLILDREWHCNSLDKTQWKSTKWHDVKVGDVLLLQRNDPIPADLVLLHVDSLSRVAYIETMALDGETNLKMKRPVAPLAEICPSPEAISQCHARFMVEHPNIDLYNFDGKVSIGPETVPLTNTEILYRGSVLRNTPTATGLVIFTGEECKIRMNANKSPRIKAPALQAVVNRVVMIAVVIVLALATFNSAAYEIWQRTTESKSWYLKLAHVAFGPIFTSFIIMFNTMIPLSLYVSLEIIKLCQMFFLNTDVDMYDDDSDTPMEARTSTINEELGQVSYIFSDKTGTLTDNSMRFRKMSVAGTAWLHDHDLQEKAQHNSGRTKLLHKKRNDKGTGRKSHPSSFVPERGSSVRITKESGSTLDRGGPSDMSTTWRPSIGPPTNALYGGRSEDMLEYIQRRPHTVFARKARLFILSMALCHTCVPERDEEGNVSFQAASPDELALVNAAKDLGYVVVNRLSNSITIKVFLSGTSEDPSYETFEVLDVIEFTSARKRMSVIVRMPDGRICIFCKGADSTVTRLLQMSDLACTLVEDIERHNSQRKSLEAQEALRRRSPHVSLGAGTARKSFNFPRTSMGALATSSAALGRKSSIRESVDNWLKERETDVDMRSPRDSAQYYSPRLSQQPLSPKQPTKPSFTMNGAGHLSFQDDDNDELVDESLVVNEKLVFERCFQHINDFAAEGLRTLLYGFRQISEEEYRKWKQIYLDATTSLADRQMLIERAAGRIENQLELLGATAIEDRLQRGVPDAVDRLRRAGIKLWMLTGDKRETAINISRSCRLVKDYSTVIVLDHEKGEVDRRMVTALADFRSGQVAHSVLVVDGQTLSLIEAETSVKELFLELAIGADSVICCRASPSQKALLVKSVRTKVHGSVTLAIGDGANDIAMIQEAHVGIGITGKEGLQAARTSDYSIAQFRFLLKLLLVQGRWNYVRVCKYTLATFWKEMLFYLTQASYQRYSGFTGTSFYEPWSLSMFNTLFTSLPVIFIGVFEKDLAASTLLAAPELYSIGQRNGAFNIKIYLWWAFLAAGEAVLIFNLSCGIYGNAIFTADDSLYATGALTFTCCVTVISLKLQVLELHNKSMAALVAVVLSVGGWYLWNILLAIIYHNNVIYDVKDGILQRFGRSLLWWLTLIVVVALFAVVEMAISTIKSTVFPTDVDVFQAFEQDRETRKRFEEAAADYLQEGGNRGTKKSSLERAREAAMEAEREQHIEDLLKRPRPTTNERTDGSEIRKRRSWPVEEDMEMVRLGCDDESETAPKRSLDAAELFSTGFGSVQKGPDIR